VTGVEKMLQRLISEDIQLVTALDVGLGPVRADPGQIELVILNLAVNARDAMPQGGKLTLETGNVELDGEYVENHPVATSGPHVMLAVSDTGCGMDRHTLSHIFEPFFTTKEPGKGTGLGLATVYGIVKQSGGNIWAYSEPGKGTTFKIFLPRVQEAVPAAAPAEGRKASPRGSETILVVEDDPAVRPLVRGVLLLRGYSVLEASRGDEALSVSESHRGPIKLLVTDIVMPGMSGRDLAEQILLRHPEIRVLYMSGYTDDAILHQGVLEEGALFLQKPFTPDALARKVREVLDTPQPARQ
jgi:two-component system cell cycle sensor histidine kinase/response regulator CckA